MKGGLATILTDAGRDGRLALLVARVAAVARETGHSVLARALTRRLVARSAQRADRVTLAR